MPRIHRTVLALVCGLGLSQTTVAEEPGIVRISDRAPQAAPAAASTRGVARVSHEWANAGPEFIGGPEVIGNYGSAPGQGWYGGPDQYGGNCYGGECYGGDRLPVCRGLTGNAILDSPWTVTCSTVACLVHRLRGNGCGKCKECRGGGGYGGAAFGAGRRIYAVDPNHFDQRDGRVYAAEGYGAPIAVPLAPTVHHTYNYGWGMPSSRVTRISRPTAGY